MDHELALIPDINGNFFQINVTQRELEYATMRKTEYQVAFYVFTKCYSDSGKPVILGDVTSLNNSNFDPKNPTRIIVHGWMSNKNSFINEVLPKAYLEKGDFNVIVVDWSDAAENYDYFAARKAIGKIGRKIAKLIDFLNSHAKTDPRTVYLIGHSLGAHVCGVAAKHIKSGRLGLLIALDAAMPLFSTYHSDRLTNSVADYVLSIHTNGGFKGILEPIGHAAFYPNWGKTQPGCGLDLFYVCAHRRCVEYFAESIANGNVGFISNKCSGFEEILNGKCTNGGEVAYLGGDPINKSYQGIFYVKTNPQQPYGIGK